MNRDRKTAKLYKITQEEKDFHFKKLTDKQEHARDIIRQNKYREILFDGGARSGKTFLIVMIFIVFGLLFPGMRMLVARLRFAHAKASIWKQTLMPMVKACFPEMVWHEDRSDYILSFSMTGQEKQSEIWLGGLDDKDRTDKILGQEYAIIFLNEAIRIAESTVDKVKSRLAQKIEGFKNFMIYDCNPGNPLHWLYQRFYVEQDEHRVAIHWMPEDNRENLNEGYIEEVLDTLKGHEYKRLRKGEWAQLPGAVYENVFAENKIECEKNYDAYDDIVLGIDFGLNTVITLWGIKEGGERAFCVEERCLFGSKETITKNIVKNLNELDKIYYIKKHMDPIYCDHEPDRIQEIEDAGYNALKAYKDIEPGDASVNSFELFFDMACNNTFQSMLNLRHQQDNHGAYTVKHIKVDDHACLIGDTLIITDSGYKKIENIKIGDKVLTRKGYKKVYNKQMTGIKETYEYEINGNKIICTNDHKFYSNNEYIPIKNLTHNDMFCTIDLLEVYICHMLNQLKLNIRELSLEDIQMQKNGMIEYIIKQIVIILNLESDIYIQKYGKIIMGLSLKVMLFIIKMKIPLITTFLIWCVLQKKNIKNIMQEIEKMNIKNYQEKILIKLEKKQKNGIKVKKEGNGINNMLKSVGLVLKKWQRNVKIVMKSLLENHGLHFVPINANLHMQEKLVNIYQKQTVLSVENNLIQTNIDQQNSVLRSVQQPIFGEPKGKNKVYSISVEDQPEYFANNILVRNSDSGRYALHGWKMDNNKLTDSLYGLGDVM